MFPAGSVVNDVQCAEVTILDNSILEGNETFNMTMAAVSSSVMIGNAITTVTISDNDSKYTI